MFSATTLIAGRTQTTIAVRNDVIVARATVYRDLTVSGLLTRPPTAAWRQWTVAEAAFTIDRAEWELAFAARARNLWSFRPRSRTYRLSRGGGDDKVHRQNLRSVAASEAGPRKRPLPCESKYYQDST